MRSPLRHWQRQRRSDLHPAGTGVQKSAALAAVVFPKILALCVLGIGHDDKATSLLLQSASSALQLEVWSFFRGQVHANVWHHHPTPHPRELQLVEGSFCVFCVVAFYVRPGARRVEAQSRDLAAVSDDAEQGPILCSQSRTLLPHVHVIRCDGILHELAVA